MKPSLARDLVDALVPPACAACDGPTSSILCARCLESVEPPPTTSIACAMFGGAVADAVRAAKFRPDAGVAEALARFWTARLAAGACPALPSVGAIAFVPAPYRRRVARGFDLPAVLAQALSRAAGAPVVDALVCARNDEPLSFGADKAARATAVAGRFRARRSFAGKRLLLVDDVRTTGATLAEAARVLTEAGAEVETATFAVAP